METIMNLIEVSENNALNPQKLCNEISELTLSPLIKLWDIEDGIFFSKESGSADPKSYPFDPSIINLNGSCLLDLSQDPNLYKINSRYFVHVTEPPIAYRDNETPCRKTVTPEDIISHELRTPLNGIINTTELIAQECPQLCEYVNIIRSCSQHILTMSNEILDYSVKPFKLAQCLERCYNMVLGMAMKKHLQLKSIIDLSVPYCISANEQKISQILINLLSNAVKYTTKGFVLTYIRAEERTDIDTVIEINVLDTGSGIDPTVLPSIFTKKENTPLNTSTGHGLGLAISKEMSHKLCGDLSVRTSPYGSIFTFTFPAHVSVHTGHIYEIDFESLRHHSVLVLDSTPIVSNMLRKLRIPVLWVGSTEQMNEFSGSCNLILYDEKFQPPAVNIPTITICTLEHLLHVNISEDNILIKPVTLASLVRCLDTVSRYWNKEQFLPLCN